MLAPHPQVLEILASGCDSAGWKAKRAKTYDSQSQAIGNPLSAMFGPPAAAKRKRDDVLTACFGIDGNFTVIVEERSGEASDDACAKRREFNVWSSLLAQWSPVFEKMVGSENYAESQKAEVIIRDFSADAVELFLRFFYSGSVAGAIPVLAEVAAMADKYQVEALHSSCLHLVRQAMKPEAACEVLASADRFHLEDLRAEALDLIFTKSAEALKERPVLRPELLGEILDSGWLCMSEDDVKKTLQNWGKENDSLQPIIEARIQRATVRTSGEHTKDVLGTLWQRYVAAGKRGAFLGYWVVVMLGPQQAEMCREDAGSVTAMARNDAATPVTFQPGGSSGFYHTPGFVFRVSRVSLSVRAGRQRHLSGSAPQQTEPPGTSPTSRRRNRFTRTHSWLARDHQTW